MKKRIVAFVLAVAMLVISLPLGAIAEEIQIDVMKPNSATAGNSGTAGEQETDNIGNLYIGESELPYVYWTGAEVTKLSKTTDEKTGEEYYVIDKPEELYFLALQVKSGNAEYAEGNYRLTANLSFESGKGEQTPPEMIPIGNEDHPFMGSFDGQGHEVAGYTISRVELTDAEQDAHKTDAKEQYIGLFGYVENATIENLGVRNYQIDYEYFYDCYVGGLVGYSKDSTITNCFADGHTAAACGSMNPLLREDVESYAGSEIPESLSSEKAGGQGVILDFRGMGSAVNKTITVSGTVNAIRLIGDAGKTYTGLNIVLNTVESYAVYVELLDMRFTGGSSKPALSGTASEVYLYSSTVTAEDGSKQTEGKSNRIAGINGAQTAVDLPDCALNICGDVALSMKGGDDTTDVKAAVTVKSISIDLRDAAGKNVDLTITGGRGKTGATGATGATGTDPTATAGTGSTGGNGYTGAMAVEAEIIAVYAGRASFYGGNGGDGGVGGTGGIGANGSNGTDHGEVRHEYQSSTEPAYSRPTSGGQGGKGGKGGDGGPGAQALECPVLFSGIAEKYVKAGHDGDGGQGGAGGKGGKGGTGARICARRNSNGWPSKGGPFMTFDDAEEKGKALFDHYDVTPAAGGKGGNGGDGGDGYHAGAGGAPGAGGDGGDAGKKDVDSRYYAAGGFSKKDEQEAYHGVYTSGVGESGQTGELAGSPGSTYPLPGIYGSALFDETVFLDGGNDAYRKYDNNGAGVEISTAAASSDNPTGCNYELVVKSVDGASPWHMGGYCHTIGSEPNKVFYYVICAKIPVGYCIHMCGNYIGDGAYTQWLTDNAGTGEWEWYIGKTVCGYSGTFDTLGFVALYRNGGTDNSVEWRVAYDNLVDAGVCDGGATVDSLNTPIVSYRTGNKEYAVYPGLASWELAEEWCEARGGYLATITSAEENALLVSLLDQSGYGLGYLGGHRVSDGSDEWCWVTGEPFEYTNWNSPWQPDDSNGIENWLNLYSTDVADGKWNDIECKHFGMAVIFERDITDDLTVETPQVSTEDLFFHAKLTAGGFIGAAENTTVEHCSVISVSDGASLLDWHKGNRADSEFSVGEFAGSADSARLSLVAAVERKSAGFAPIDNTSGAWGFAYSEALDVQYTKIGFDHTTGIGRVDKDGRSYELQYSQNLTGEGTKAAYVTARSVVALPSATKGAAVTIPQYVYSGAFFAKVNEIGAKAFENTEIGSIDTKDVETVGDSAFAGSSLTYAYLNDGVRSVGKNIFLGCEGLKTIVIGKNLERTGITDIKAGLTVFGLGDFTYDKKNDKVTISESNLEKFIVDPENEDLCAVDGILYGLHSSAVSMLDPESKQQIQVKIAVKVLAVPRMIDIGDYAPGLNDERYFVTFGEKTQAYQLAIMYIGEKAFAYNKNITSVNLRYIRSVGESAFRGSAIQSVTFGSFGGLPETEQIVLGNTNADGTFTPLLDANQNPVTVAGARESYITRVENYAFADCKNLRSADLSAECLLSIGLGAFQNSGNYAKPMTIEIGKNVEFIGYNGENETDYDDMHDADSFEGASIAAFAVAEGNRKFHAEDGVLYRRVLREEGDAEWYLVAFPCRKEIGTYTMVTAFSVTETETEFSVSPVESDTDENPKEYVTVVNYSAFYGAEDVTHVIVSDRVVSIRDYAFTGAQMQSVYLGARVASLGTSPHEQFTGAQLRKIVVDPDNSKYFDRDGVLYARDSNGWKLLRYPQNHDGKAYTVASDITVIGKAAFSRSQNLVNLTLNGDITKIEEDAFQGSKVLSVIHFCSTTDPRPFLDIVDLNKNTEDDSLGRSRFNAGKRNLIVAYTDDPNGYWKEREGARQVNDGTQNTYTMFAVEKFRNYDPGQDREEKPYIFQVMDSQGYPINGVTVKLTDITDDTIGTPIQSIRTQGGLAGFTMEDFDTIKFDAFDKEYALYVVDDTGAYFPFSDPHFRLDADTRVTYVTLSSVPSVEGTNVVASVAKTEDFETKVTSGLFNLRNSFDGGYSIQESIQTEVKRFNNQLFSTLVVSANASYDTNLEIADYYLSSRTSGTFIEPVGLRICIRAGCTCICCISGRSECRRYGG